MRVIHLNMTPSNVSLTGFASNVTGATWTLTTHDIPDGLAHQVSIHNDSGTDHSGKTALLTGKDQDGNTQTETVTLPGATLTVESSLYFKTLTTIVPSSTIGADTMDIGWVDEFISPTIPMDLAANSGGAISVYVTGTINYTVQETLSDVQAPVADLDVRWLDSGDSAVVAQTASKDSNFVEMPVATRLKINSYSNGATIQYHVAQSGYY